MVEEARADDVEGKNLSMKNGAIDPLARTTILDKVTGLA